MSDSIIVGVSKARGSFMLFSDLIQLVDHSPFSHAYIRLTIDGNEVVYQASGIAVNFMSISVFNEKEIVYREFVFPVGDDLTK